MLNQYKEKMKTIIRTIYFSLLAAIITLPATAQQSTAGATLLEKSTIEPFVMEVTFDQTSHILFPAAIRYVDLGGEYLTAGKAQDAPNVLRVKAAVRNFDVETNFSVITDDGIFYPFTVCYSPQPAALSYDLVKLRNFTQRQSSDAVLIEELGNHPPSLAGMLLTTIYNKNSRAIRHISAQGYGVQFLLKGLYTHNGRFYFHTELRNKTAIPYSIDFITFRVVDKKVAKRAVAQEQPLSPLRMYKPLLPVGAESTGRNVFLLDQFTIADDKMLEISIYEKNGARHQVLQVESSDLFGARRIDQMHLKIKP